MIATHEAITPDDIAYYEDRVILQYSSAVVATVVGGGDQIVGFRTRRRSTGDILRRCSMPRHRHRRTELRSTVVYPGSRERCPCSGRGSSTGRPIHETTIGHLLQPLPRDTPGLIFGTE